MSRYNSISISAPAFQGQSAATVVANVYTENADISVFTFPGHTPAVPVDLELRRELPALGQRNKNFKPSVRLHEAYVREDGSVGIATIRLMECSFPSDCPAAVRDRIVSRAIGVVATAEVQDLIVSAAI